MTDDIALLLTLSLFHSFTAHYHLSSIIYHLSSTPMPFLTDNEPDVDDGAESLRTENARRESTKNIVAALQNDLSQPKMYVQEVDPDTGFPVGKKLVSGGLEYFNDHGPAQGQIDDIDAFLSGDMSIDEAMTAIVGPSKPMPPVPMPAATHPTSPNDALRLLGLDFIQPVPSMPGKHVQLSFTGPITFQVPLVCHEIICTDSLVILVTDKRSVPASNEMDFGVDRDSVQASLLFPDKTVVLIVAPVPRTVSFEIGILRCTLFVKR
jgi:hypothetical protein